MVKVLTHVFYPMSRVFSSEIVEKFKTLLENKHLYQRVKVEFPSLELVLQKTVFPPDIGAGKGYGRATVSQEKECEHIYGVAAELGWKIENPRELNAGYYTGNMPDRREVDISFSPPSIKIYCPICDRIEPHNFCHGEDFTQSYKDFENRVSPNLQTFLLAYECQSCKTMPVVFMVRREKMKLILSGRVPMEEIVVSNVIPKRQKKFFSDAVIAYNSGQTLAGKFLLRTFVEQYIREFTGNEISQNIDELFDKYAEKLPKDFKERFPSLSAIYSKLSIDLHKADANLAVFDRCREDIEEHFEARKLFKL